VTALESLSPGRRITWVGHRGDDAPAGASPAWNRGPLRPVLAPDAVVDAAVNGFANRALWPALHGFTPSARWGPGWLDAHYDYNELVAAVVADETDSSDDATVWIHDYQLISVPRLLRQRRSQVPIGFSLHTPFVQETMSALPSASTVALGLSGASCIGVQTEADRAELVEFLQRHEVSVPHVFVSPVSIDVDALRRLREDATTASLRRRELERTGQRTLIVGVDRLDYTKGIPERLRALGRAFQSGSLDPEQVRFVQIAEPTRQRVAEYRMLRTDTERLAHELQTRWVRADGSSPFEVIVDSLDRRSVAALLSIADVCVVSPIRDGMNLVAKEFSAVCKPDGVLVLSEGAGASHELGPGCVMVDGSDVASVAAGIVSATRLGESERRSMAKLRFERVSGWTARDWCDHSLGVLASVR
jgi:trehalose 6-phosphate synthase